MYMSLIVNTRSSLTHLHGFQLLVLLPQLIEITFLVFTNRISLLNLKYKQASKCWKGVLETAKPAYTTTIK